MLTLVNTIQNTWADNTYQYEVLGSYANENSDAGFDSNGYIAGIQAFLNPVIEGDYPYAESSFVARQPFVAAAIGRVNANVFSDEISGNLYMVGAAYASKNFPVFAEIQYIRSDQSGEINRADVDFTTVSKNASLGVYFDDKTAAKFSYGKQNYEVNSANSSEDGDENQYEIAFKKLISTPSASFVNVEASASYEKDNDSIENKNIGFLADYYPNKTLGLGAGFILNKGDDKSDEGKYLVLKTRKYVASNLAFGLLFSKFFADDSESDNQNIQIDAVFRF